MKSETKTPKWESAILAAAFALIWTWFFARGFASAAIWNAILLLAVVALIVVLVRRIRRTVAAIRKVDGRD